MAIGSVVAAVGWIAQEVALFAAIGFALGGIDDLAVDLAFAWLKLKRLVRGKEPDASLDAIVTADLPGPIVIFIAAWDESAVIGAMLRNALTRYDYPDYRIYVGTYPNDGATIDAVACVAEGDARVRLVIGPRDGPTTKADCLNQLWLALHRDEAGGRRKAAAILLHDAEDVVHHGELRVVADRMREADVVQLPVVPLVDPQSRLISGHYLDEFSEAHGKQMLVRQAIGAAMPLAGVGCAIARPMLEQVADARGGLPFDAESLVEDYELGLMLGAMGARMQFALVAETAGGQPVAVRAYFPGRVDAAVRQKARWMTGIALAGWDRTGWARAGAVGDHWMRMRDRRALLAVIVLAAAYLSLVAWAVLVMLHWAGWGDPLVLSLTVTLLLKVNAALLLWRLAMRAAFVGRAAGWREASLSAPRMVVANFIALMAARRAVMCYAAMLRGQAARWDKTAHKFPDLTAGGPR